MRKKTSDRTKETVHRFRVGFGRKRRASCFPCLSLVLGDNRRSTSGSGEVSLLIFIISVLCRESLRFLLGFIMTFDAAERNGRFGRIQCQRGKKSSSRGKKRVFLCRRTVRVKLIGSHLNELSES